MLRRVVLLALLALPAGAHDVEHDAEHDAERDTEHTEATTAPSNTPSPAPPVGTTAGNVDDALLQQMVDGGHSVYVEGAITLDGATKNFAWGFDTATRFTDCELEDGSLGVVVPEGSAGEWQVTIHGDHLFYDDLASEDAVLRTAAIVAADANDDGAVTREELAAVDLTTLPADQYGTGGAGNVFTLDAFIADLTRTLVHHTGEGHCTATAL